MAKGNMYSFQKWLMIGMILIVISATFSQFPLSSSEPNITDYDVATESGQNDYFDALDSYEGQVALFAAVSSVLQTGAVALLGYAFFRESHEDENLHVAVRITMVLAGVILITGQVGRGFSLF
jgi:hypothetical protein